ncbi:hypothetical protein GCM10020255_042800 [Rhodococcus baikonurensis]
MEEFGLASRDAVALSGDIEDLLGVTLTATVAYQHPTIASLATRIIEGEPEAPEETVDASYYVSGGATDAHDIAIVGLSTRFPGAGHTPSDMWEMLAAGRDGISDLPEDRWAEFMSDPAIKAAVENANTKGGYLDDVKGFDAEFFAMSPLEVVNVDPQQRLALEARVGSARARAHSGKWAQGQAGRCFHRQFRQRLPAARGQRSDDGAPVCADRNVDGHRR